MATKTLNFYAHKLEHDTTLMLMFKPPGTEKLYHDQFPHVWSMFIHPFAFVKYLMIFN
jgi:hypothetical protein